MTEYIELEAVSRSFSTDDTLSGYEKAYCKEIIKKIPAADVAPVRHAYWVPEEHVDQVSPTTTHRYTWYYCSECGRRLIGYKNPIDAPYCHCGAKMDGGEYDGTST